MIDRPAARYGRTPLPRRSRPWVIAVLTALVLAVGLAVAIAGYQRLGSREVEGTLAGYQLIDNETVAVTITVTRQDPSRPAVCIVRARSIDGTETGRREVLVPPSQQATIALTTNVKTSRPPVVGDVYGCGLDVPAYLVPG